MRRARLRGLLASGLGASAGVVPFYRVGLPPDNSSHYVNQQVAALMKWLGLEEFAKPRRCTPTMTRRRILEGPRNLQPVWQRAVPGWEWLTVFDQPARPARAGYLLHPIQRGPTDIIWECLAAGTLPENEGL